MKSTKFDERYFVFSRYAKSFINLYVHSLSDLVKYLNNYNKLTFISLSLASTYTEPKYPTIYLKDELSHFEMLLLHQHE